MLFCFPFSLTVIIYTFDHLCWFVYFRIVCIAEKALFPQGHAGSVGLGHGYFGGDVVVVGSYHVSLVCMVGCSGGFVLLVGI